MLVSCSKILVILVLAQYVTSVEFYISKRVPPKYKAIRRTYSLKSKEENGNSEPAVTFLEKKIDRNTSIGNVETTDNIQSSFITISTNDNGGSIAYPLKNEEQAKTEPVEADVNNNSDQDKESVDDMQINEDKQPSFTSTVKPKRRPFYLRKISKSAEINVNESNDRDKVSTDEIQTTNKKQFSLTTSTITAKRRNFNLRPLRNKGENAQSKPIETFVKEDIDEEKESIDDIRVTKEKEPSVTTTAIKPKRRFSNLRIFKNRVEKVQSIPAKTFVIVNTDQDKVSIGNFQIREEIPVATTRKIKPLRRTLNVYSLKRKEEKTDSKLVSSGKVQSNEDKKSIVTTSTMRAIMPPTLGLRSTLKKKEQEGDSKFIETIVDEDTYQDKVSDGNIQITSNEKPTMITNIVKHESPASSVYLLEREEENTDGETDKALINENAKQDKVAIDNIQIIRDKKPIVSTSTAKSKTSNLRPQSLKNKEESTDSEYIETIVNENTGQIKVALSNVEVTGDKKLSVTTSTVKPKTFTLSQQSQEKQTDSESIATIVNENTGQIKVALSNVEVTGDKKLSVTTSTVKPKTSTLSQQSQEKLTDSESIETIVNENIGQMKVSLENLKITEEDKLSYSINNDSNDASLETIVNENTRQNKVSASNVQATGEKKVTFTTSTIKPRRRTLNLYSLKRTEENFDSKIVATLKNDQDQVTASNVRAAGDKKLIVTTTLKPKTSTTSAHSLKKETDSESVETIFNENTGQITVSIGNVQATGETEETVTSSTIKPRTRTLNLYSLKRTEENFDSKIVATLKNDQDQVTASNVRAAGDKKLIVTTTLKPKTSTTSAHSLKKETDSESVETIFNENTGQITVSVGNVQATGETEETVTSNTIKPKTRSRNLYSLKRKEENSENEAVATPVNEKTDRDQMRVVTSNIRATGDKKLRVTSTIMKPQRRVLNVNSLQKNEENTNSEPMKTLVNENINQEKASIGDVQSSRDTKFTLISSTIKPKRPTLNLDSLKINEDNPKSKTIDTFISKHFDREKISIDNVQSEQATTNEKAHSHISTEEPKILTVNSAISENGSKRIIKTQRKIVVQNTRLDAESKPSTVSSISNKDRHMKVVAAQAPQSYGNYYQTTTPYTQIEKTTQKHDEFVPIIGVENYVYAYNGDYHYSYEGGDGTKAFERGELKSADGSSNSSGVVGGYSYKDKDGNDFSLSYTAGEGGYQPVGAHLPTPPPIPPAIQRVLRILATKTTPETITERIKNDH